MKYINIILGVFMAIVSIALSVIITLNLTIVYELSISRFNLTEISGLSSWKLMDNYNSMINYLKNPFVDKLTFNDFPMSITGEIHFQEVKRIFMGFYIIIISFILVYILLKCIKKVSAKINFRLMLNYCSNTIIVLFISAMIVMLIDFSKVFEIFHKIFFRNNYWQFNPITDPIINVLPEGVFMSYAFVIIALLIVQAIIYKVIYYKYKKTKKYIFIK